MANAESEALIGVPLTSLDWVISVWTSPVTDLQNDCAVVIADSGDVAGYHYVESAPPYTEVMGIGVVALEHHGRGVGGAMVDDLYRRADRFVALAPAGERVAFRAGALADEPHVSALLRDRGYAEVRRFSRMGIIFEGRPRDPVVPDGIQIRPLGEGDEPAVYACLAEAFADHFGETFPEFDEWIHRQIATDSGFDPSVWQVAWAGATVAGVSVGTLNAEEDATLGYVAELGVRRAYRGRGLGEAVLRASFQRFYDVGRAGVYLYVDTASDTGADRLYLRAGMTSQPRFATWEKELRPAAE